MFAVNIADMAQDGPKLQTAAFLIAPVRGQIVAAESTLDGYALVLDCPDERAEAIMRLFQIKNIPVRCYRSSGKNKEPMRVTWRKL